VQRVWVRGFIGNRFLQGRRQEVRVGVRGIGGWIGLRVTAGLDLIDKFGAIAQPP